MRVSSYKQNESKISSTIHNIMWMSNSKNPLFKSKKENIIIFPSSLSRNSHSLLLLLNFKLKSKIKLIQCLLCIISSFSLFAQEQDIQIANEYYLSGQKEKAYTMYKTLSKKNENIYSIYNNYISLLIEKELFNEAEKYIEKILKRKSNKDEIYSVDLGIIYRKSGDNSKADKYLKSLITNSINDVGKVKAISDYLASKQLADYSVFALQKLRERLRNPNLFTIEMANLYRALGKTKEMINEYLNYISVQGKIFGHPDNLRLIQNFINTPAQFESLERQLYIKIQKYPESFQYPELLIWVNLKQKQFYRALVQAKAYDRRFRPKNLKTLEVANIALNNNDYSNAIKAYDFVINEFKGSVSASKAQFMQIKTKETMVKESLPISIDSIRLLIYEYQRFIKNYPQNRNSYESALNEALLHAYFLNEKDSAIQKLNYLLTIPQISRSIYLRAKLELGDIYLLDEQPWESTLLYSQVEKELKATPMAYEAKLRNAKLSYYKGNFKLAQEHLDILKQATTHDISNNAMELSNLIKENTTFDTLGLSLRQFSKIQLLLAQNKHIEALDHIKKFKNGMYLVDKSEAQKLDLNNQNYLKEAGNDNFWIKIPEKQMTYELSDDVYWLESSIRMKLNEYSVAISLCQKIVDNFPKSVFADDAMFRIGKIYELYHHDIDKAKTLYRNFLDLFPGSVYVSEARKKYRLLRGDQLKEEIKN